MTEQTQLSSRLSAQLDQQALDHLASQAGIADPKAIRRAVSLTLPSVVEKLYGVAETGEGQEALSHMLTGIRSNGVDSNELADLLFGDQRVNTAHELASQCNIDPTQADAVVALTSSWALSKAASLVDDPQSLPRILSSGSVVRTDSHQEPVAAEPAAEPVRAQNASSSRQNRADAKKSSNSTTLIAAGVAAMLFLGGLFFIATGGGGTDDEPTNVATAADASSSAANDESTAPGLSEEPNDAADTSTPDTAVAAEPETATASADQATDADTTTVSAAAPAASNEPTISPTITKLVVPMRDINGVEPAAAGTIDLNFDTLTGQICFEVGSLGVNPPYAGHIHAGNFGVKGGVVVDFGVLEDGATGCIDNLPADTLAILAQPSRHYAELHDAGGEWTVRGQLSETVDTQGIIPFSIPMRDILGTSPSASGVLNFEFNTLTGEVCYSVFAVGVSPPFRSHIHEGPFGVKGGVVLDMGGLESGNQGCVENDLADTLAILADPAGHYAEIHDAGEEWTVRGQLTETIENPGIVSLAVPMVDIKNVEPSAQGILAFDFNTVTGEICYDVSAANISAPFNSHIHAGDYGVKGGVVVDLGGLQDGSGGCVDNTAADTLAILSDPSGHYAELHDSGGEWTIRGQLSEANNAIDPNATNLLIDTDGGGASMRLENGTIFLEGNVDSDAVADEMVASLRGITTPIVNNLQIVPGSPLPSGRVVIGDNVFFDTGSDDIKDLPAGTVTALVELANSRPDWVIAIVGHTDNVGSDVYNLELSLRRAEALRQVLVTQGMNSDNMRIRGAGETKPIADNASESGRALNRRIEFEFTPA